MRLQKELTAYAPRCEQEAQDRAAMLRFLALNPDALTRRNAVAHFTASAWIVNPGRDKVLMVWHNIYRSWSWTGGHADGEDDLLAVALREAREETGVHAVPVCQAPLSLETLVVEGHEKRGVYVPCHLHMNLTYLLEAREDEALRAKPDENSGVRWFAPGEAAAASTEPWMRARVYEKLNRRLAEFPPTKMNGENK